MTKSDDAAEGAWRGCSVDTRAPRLRSEAVTGLLLSYWRVSDVSPRSAALRSVWAGPPCKEQPGRQQGALCRGGRGRGAPRAQTAGLVRKAALRRQKMGLGWAKRRKTCMRGPGSGTRPPSCESSSAARSLAAGPGQLPNLVSPASSAAEGRKQYRPRRAAVD